MTTSLDLPGILTQHADFHNRLNDGEFNDAPEGTFDELLGNEQLRPIVQAIGVKGVGDLIHIAHELAIQVFNDDALRQPEVAEFSYGLAEVEPEPDPDVQYVRAYLEHVAQWVMVATMTGRI